MAQIMSDEQRLAILEDYRPQEHLISVGKNKDNSPVLYYPAAWRLYELRLRHPFFTLEAEIIHMNEEQGTVIVKAIGYDGLDYASSNLKGTALKQGQLKELDKVETKAKSRVARDIGIGTEYALDMDADETDGIHQTSTLPRSSRNGNASKSTEVPKVDDAAARRFINPLKMKAMKAGFIAGSSDAELIKAWHEAKRSVFLREVSDTELIGSEELRVQMRDAIDRHVQLNQSEQKAS